MMQRIKLLLVLSSIVAVAPVHAQSNASPPPPPPPEEGLPEYRTKALPSDTFKPSEEVSTDFAVPFPADI
jgi:hypothetical protein